MIVPFTETYAMKTTKPKMNKKPKDNFVVQGSVHNNEGTPLANVVIKAFDQDIAREDLLGGTTTDRKGNFTIRYTSAQFRHSPKEVGGPDLIVRAYFDDGQLMVQSKRKRNAKREENINLVGLEKKYITYHVEGRVTSSVRTGVGGLRVRIMDKTVGKDVKLEVAVTDDEGKYQATFTDADLQNRGKARPDLQAHVFAGKTFLGASDVHYNASALETLNILLTDEASKSLPAEYETLTRDLSKHFKGRLGDLEETKDRQDITYLANKTGWDARAVALASQADNFSAHTIDAKDAIGIAPTFFYALFRAGVPANEQALYRTNVMAVKSIWEKAVAQGVISADLGKSIPSAIKKYKQLSSQKLLDGPAPVGVSTLKGMLNISLGKNSNQHKKFADIQVKHGRNLTNFWKDVRKEFGEQKEKRLRLDGQLAYLTINNAPLIRKLHTQIGHGRMTNLIDLVKGGYYHAAKWSKLIGKGAIPPEIPGKNKAEKRSRYAQMLATQMRISFPTAVVAQMVKSKETPLVEASINSVSGFLMNHQGKFQIGMQPVEQYVKQNKLKTSSNVIKEITRIQRVYRIAPNIEAMNALLKKKVDSAYAITRYDRDEFVQTFKNRVGGQTNARLIHAKAQQVHNAVLNIAVSYLTASKAPGIGVHSDGKYINPEPAGPNPNASDIIAYPTLEKLLGEMDYCNCEHCRSILSPAAYLVNLLQFIDLRRYNDQGNELPTTYDNENPLDVLLSRRPDIQHLPLTCENTNTPLPYIDLVNEILEFYVANGRQFVDANGDIYKGHSTDGSATPAELLASPQFGGDQVSVDAYKTLSDTASGTAFPPPLPFHQPLENLRRYFDKFEAPLPQVMEALRRDDNIERAGANEYGWRDILMEELRLSRAEYDLLTVREVDPASGASDLNLTLKQLYGYGPDKPDADVLAELSNAKVFTRRVGISYEDLGDILKTRFVNPHSTLIPKLERLGVSFETLKNFKKGRITDQEFDKALAPQLDPAQYGGDIKAWVTGAENYANIMSLITLSTPLVPWAASTSYKQGDCVLPSSPPTGSNYYYECATPGTSAGVEPDPWPTTLGKNYTDGTVEWTCKVGLGNCSFDTLRFRYANPDKLAEPIRLFEFIRLIRFIRLWKKLGWGIEQTDKAITALYPTSQIPDDADGTLHLQKLDDGFLVLLPRLGVVKHVMDMLKLKPKKDLLSLLACFAPIDTHGSESLYRQMFLSPALLRQAPAFADDGYGNCPRDDTQKLSAHAETLRAAFLLTDDELREITNSLGYDINTLLNLDNITAVFRRGWLARKLKLSVREFLLLAHFTGFDPFAMPDPVDPPILGLIKIVDSLRTASLKPEQALYLIWNQDISGKSTPDISEISGFAHTLRSALNVIESEFALADDPDGQIARARMALVYGNEATDLFFGLLENTRVTDVPYTHRQPLLEKDILDVAPGRIAYDNLRKRLSYNAGVMPDATRDALKGVAGVTQAFKNAVEELHKKTRIFFDRYPKLKPLFDVYAASNDPVEKKRSDLLANFLPELKQRRKHQQALQIASAEVNTDLGFASALLDDSSVLLASDNSHPVLADIIEIEIPGLSAQFFFKEEIDNPIPKPDTTSDAQAQLDYSSGGDNKLPTNPNLGIKISGIWSGYIEAPENGFYDLSIETDKSVTIKPKRIVLTLNGSDVDLIATGSTRSTNTFSNEKPIELRAGTLYPITLKVEKVKEILSVRWETSGRGREVIPSRYLHSETLIQNLRRAYIRFLKTVSLAGALKLTASETTYFASHTDYQIGGHGWLNSLPVMGNPDNAASSALLTAFNALLKFAIIKADLAPNDERLLTVLKDPSAVTQNLDNLLITLTRWEPNSLNTLLNRFSIAIADLAHIEIFQRVYDAFIWVRKLGVSASSLIKAATNEPDAETVRDLQSALRARFDESGWLDILKPINDDMRSLQRDALVAYILHQMSSDQKTMHIDTPEKLFEYFLMDVEMDPCTQTSRIRHALSSVQLFIERCLMNLETRVAPSSINARHWEWMKRYRVWEANRKVFLYPENWLEPELRDDQSPFFKEAMSELLQGDITEDRAEVALLNYLSKLEEVAKLESCDIHYVENDPSKQQDDVAHVVARTAGANRKYFYRRLEAGSWTPWEQIKLDIEDNPVKLVVWKDRLLLFWLRILKQAPIDSQAISTTSTTTGPLASLSLQAIKEDAKRNAEANTKVTVQAVLCWSEYYNGKWQPTKTSDANRPILLGRYGLSEELLVDRSQIWFRTVEESNYLRVVVSTRGMDIWIWVNVQGPFSDMPTMPTMLHKYTLKSISFFLYNTHSEPILELNTPIEYGYYPRINYNDNEAGRFMGLSDGYLVIFDPSTHHQLMLKSTINWRLVPGNCQIDHVAARYLNVDLWRIPFFFEDSRHVFYVTPSEHNPPISEHDGYVNNLVREPAMINLPNETGG